MTLFDWSLVLIYVLVLAVIVIRVVLNRDKDTQDYFLASRDATWLAIGASIFASNIGSEHLIGLTGTGAESGMAMAHWEMHGWLILMLGWVFVPFYDRTKVFTMPEFLERRYNSSARMFLSFISLVGYILTKVAVTVYAGGVTFQAVTGIKTMFGIDFFWIAGIGLVILTGLFTIFGGMKAIMKTAIIQAPILIGGSLVILILGLKYVGGWDTLMEVCKANINPPNTPSDNMTSLVRSASDPQFPWTGVLLGSAIIGFWYWCTDQYIVQRVLAGRDQTQARRGAIFGGYLKLTPVFIFLIPGMIAYALKTQGAVIDGQLFTFASSDEAYPTLVKMLLPVGVKGLVMVGILSALMSSLSSKFNSSAMLFTIDFYQKYVKDKTPGHYVVVGRIATAVIVVLGILWIPVMRSLGKVLYEYLQDVQSLIAPGIAAVFLLGILSKRVTGPAGLWGLIVGFVLGMFRLVIKIVTLKTVVPDNIPAKDATAWIAQTAGNTDALGMFDAFCVNFMSVNWLHYEIFLFFLCIVLIIVISAFTQKSRNDEQTKGLTFASASPEQRAETRASWNKWDVVNSAIVLTIIIAFYIYFW